MRNYLIWIGAFLLCQVHPTQAHLGEQIFLIYEIRDDELGAIDVGDGDVEDWREIVGEPSLRVKNFYQDPTLTWDGPYYPEDISWEVWLGWNQSHHRLYLALDRVDDRYVNEYQGEGPAQMWRYDSLEFKVDGDHSGGEFGYTSDCCETEEEWRSINNSHAQQYNAIAETPDGRHLANGGILSGPTWAVSLPYADAGGAVFGDNLTKSVTEFFVTPFDSLAWDAPDESQVSDLFLGKVIGFELSIIDYDTYGLNQENVDLMNYFSLSSQAATWRFAERFVDGRLVGPSESTAVKESSWARIKAAFRSEEK